MAGDVATEDIGSSARSRVAAESEDTGEAEEMSMTKKERAAFDAAIHKANLLCALRWTEPVQPDVPIPGFDDGMSKGFLFNTPSRRVVPAYSTRSYHSFGRNDRTDTQNPCALYSTRLLALKAMRHEAENKFAAELLSIDKMIEAEKADNTLSGD